MTDTLPEPLRLAAKKIAKDRQRQRDVYQKGMLACYEVIEQCRKLLAEMDAEDAAAAASSGS